MAAANSSSCPSPCSSATTEAYPAAAVAQSLRPPVHARIAERRLAVLLEEGMGRAQAQDDTFLRRKKSKAHLG